MAKKAITIIASEETYTNLSTFTTIGDLNNTVRYYKEKFADQLTKSSAKVLDMLHRYSCKYPGVSFLSKSTIAETLNISRRTVIRVCQLLELLGVIKQYEAKCESDKQTSNAIVIQPNVTQASPEMSHKDNTSLKQDIKIINTIRTVRKSDSTTLWNDFIPTWVNKQFANLSSCYVNSDTTVELWRIATIHSRINELSIERLVEASVEALKTTVYKYKKGSIKTTFNSYFNGIMKKLCKKYWIIDLFDDVLELRSSH